MNATLAQTPNSARELFLQRLRGLAGSFVSAADLPGVPPARASKLLAGLAQDGVIERTRKGLYFVPRETLLGRSRPSATAVAQRVMAGRGRPTGITAANLLGLSTQVAARPEYALYASAPPRGTEVLRLHLRPRTRVPALPARDGALLEFLRDRGRYGELEPAETCNRLRALLRAEGVGESDPERLRRMVEAALLEPSRVRAILGALLQSAELPEEVWSPLRASLNGLSRFDFGLFRVLPQAQEWQARCGSRIKC